MGGKFSIVTIGLSPAWDITCRGQNLDWGLHKYIDEQTIRPAGKALNVSKALAWMGEKNIAAGLWGGEDYEQMLKGMRLLKGLVKVKMTAVAGSTRQNITIVDTANNREMHLRSRSDLAWKKALRKLEADLRATVYKGSVCVFAGAMPQDELYGDVVRIIKSCRECDAKIVVDTFGKALKLIVETGDVWLVKPNVEELCELVGEQVGDKPAGLAKAGRKLLDRVATVLISRGKNGGVVVTKDGAWQGRCVGRRKVLSTVGCGDYLLAGFLKGLKDKFDGGSALETAIKVATARAWGWTDKMSWLEARSKIKVQVRRM